MSQTDPRHYAKVALRDQLLTHRRRRSLHEVATQAAALAARASEDPLLSRALLLGCYVSRGSEPGTEALLLARRRQGLRSLVPLLLPDNDLDWAEYAGPDALAPARLGLLEPTTPPLGPTSVGACDVLLVPGLATDSQGGRLGRGGGSYDRVLARLNGSVPVVAVLYDDEVNLAIPLESHDRRVDGVLTPSGVSWFGSVPG